MVHVDGFLFLALPISPNWNALNWAADRIISSFSFSTIPIFSDTSLWITLAHFALSSYEQAIRLPTSFLSSGLAGLGEN